MKAAIMTLALSDNYGAVLQTHGLSHTLRKLGVEAENYRYQDWSRITYGMSAVSRVKYEGQKIVKAVLTGGMRAKKFRAYREKFVPFTERLYKNNAELRQDPGVYDVYISGSDQIWNPGLFVYDYSYFLDFIPDHAKRISYASSFGKASFAPEYREKCGRLLEKYAHISVREKSGETIVESLCRKTACTVLDPTLLLSRQDWEAFMEDASEKAKAFRGILCYIMPGDKVVEKGIESIARQLREKTGLPIVRLGIKEYNCFRYPPEETDIKAGPADFLAYFSGARYIVTNSFHGTAFSVNFGKECYIPINDSLGQESALHERIVSLLTLTEATGCMISACNPILPGTSGIDSGKIIANLSRLRENSIAYLKHALEINDENN